MPGIKKLLKNTFLLLNNKTIKSRFFFDVEYKKWKKYFAKNSNLNVEKQKKHEPLKNVYFLVPGTGISGGVAVILKHANMLLEKGNDVKILSLAVKNDSAWFPDQKVQILPYKETRRILQSGEVDVLIATAYSTAFTVAMAKAKRKIYFVQSDESRFFPEDPKLCNIIRESYALQMEYITEAKWIQKWLKDEFGHDAYYVPNGIDENIFFKTEPIEPKTSKPRVLIEGSINVPFKGMDNAYAAVKDLDCELWIVSNNGKPKKGWKYDRFFENVPFAEMNKIYSSCDIFLKMSKVEGFFGPPMEAMACGCAVVVGKVTGYDEYIVDGENALVVEQGDVEGAKKAVQRLINDRELRTKLIANGHQIAKQWSWSHSIELLESVVAGEDPRI